MQSPVEKNKSLLRLLPGDAERQARLQKMVGLRSLRSHCSCLRLDPDAEFHDVIDCSALFELPKVSGTLRDGRPATGTLA
ncbi:hypothetical protein CK230_29850 [Mesorhizobium sp. WSM3859]|nr:hypothetical protein CK230_29850 [Mesorhizobium sp. WSM3859]